MTNEAPENSPKIVGIEISDAAFTAVFLGSGASIAGSRQTAFDQTQPNLPQLIEFAGRLKQDFGEFSHLGVAVPGVVRKDTKRVAFSAYIPEHSEIDLSGEIASATGAKVVIENDANAAAYGEYRIGAGRGSRDMFYATLGTGVGGAFIFDGKVWRGISGFAGEFGYVAVNSDGTRLEEVASAESIVRRTRSRFHQDRTSSLNNLREDQISLTDIIDAAHKNDDFAQMMLRRTGVYVGTAIADVINLLNIEKIVVGGEIMRAEHLVLDAIVQRARELSFAPSFERARIAVGQLGENAAAVGAALLASEV